MSAQQQPESLARAAGALWAGERVPALPGRDTLGCCAPGMQQGLAHRCSQLRRAQDQPLPRGQVQASTQEGPLTTLSRFLDQ